MRSRYNQRLQAQLPVYRFRMRNPKYAPMRRSQIVERCLVTMRLVRALSRANPRTVYRNARINVDGIRLHETMTGENTVLNDFFNTKDFY